MVGGLQERRYQLTAHKRNEAYLKHNYLQQTARYFERESGIAKHYNSWNPRDVNEHLEKAKKSENLEIRRNKLKILLKEEEDRYIKEIEQSKGKNKQPRVEPTLEVLKKRLQEIRAEQTLYLPKTSRRYQSNFVRPKDSLNSSNSLFSFSSDTSQGTKKSHPNRIIHSPQQGDKGMKSCSSNDKENQLDSSYYSPTTFNSIKSKYSQRYSRKSLSNTNVTMNDEVDHAPPKQENNIHSHDSSLIADQEQNHSYREFHSTNDHEESSSHGKIEKTVLAAGKWSRNTNDSNRHLFEYSSPDHQTSYEASSQTPEVDTKSNVDMIPESPKNSSQNDDDPHRSLSESPLEDEAKHESAPLSSESKSVSSESSRKIKHDIQVEEHRQFESEKSFPWLRMIPSDKNLSEQMFLYLTHKQLKDQMDDLMKRELHACTKRNWTEALRLRDMRNRLELLRENKLYGMDSLDLDDEARQMGIENIEKRARELAARENVCTDSTMYSEEAKELWDQWVREDDASGIQDARTQREVIMTQLEKEWQGLAIQDKEKISQSHQRVTSDSSLQNEHKLTANLAAEAQCESLQGCRK